MPTVRPPAGRLSLLDVNDLIRRADGSAWAKATSKIEEIGSAAAAPVLLVSEAWRTYDLRCQA